MRMIWAAVLVLGGCAAPSVKDFVAPDGRAAHSVTCSNQFGNLEACYTAARAACGGDYDLLSKDMTPRGTTQITDQRLEFICKP